MKNQRLLRISYQVLSFLLTLSLIGVGFFIIVFIISIFYPPILETQNFVISIPIQIQDLPIHLSNGTFVNVSTSDLSVTFDDISKLPILSYLYGLNTIVMTLIGIYFVYVIKLLMRGAINNNPFNSRLFKNIKYAAVLQLSSIILHSTIIIWAKYYIQNNIDLRPVSDLKISQGVNIDYLSPLSSLIVVVVIIALAEILRQGAKLKEEQESII